MFTGIIEELGSVRSIEERGENARIVIDARVVTEGTNHGDSIAVNGVCLTALDIHDDSFAADVSRETLLRSTLGSLKPGAPVNLERAVTPATRLGGHMVQGHVDARGKFVSVDGSWRFLDGADRLSAGDRALPRFQRFGGGRRHQFDDCQFGRGLLRNRDNSQDLGGYEPFASEARRRRQSRGRCNR